MTTHARPLAVWLAAADDSELKRLFAERGVRPDASWHDFFDAAEALLDPTSLDRVLRGVTDDEARVLTAAATGATVPASARLVALGVQQADGTLLVPVVDAVTARPLPAVAHFDTAPATESSSALAAERAFTSVAAIADLLLATRDAPFSLLSTGGLTAAERRRMAEAGVSLEHVDPLLALGETTGLTRQDGRALRITRRGDDWLALPAVERWSVAVLAFRAALPHSLRTPEGGWVPTASWSTRHPWDPDWAARSAELLRRAVLLGLVDDEGREPAWAVPLRDGEAPDIELLRAMLPAEVDRIFLQNDLTAIAPGPLASVLDVRLRSMARRESAAQASTYRFTADSLAHAIAEGESEESIITFLSDLTLTDIPQPLRYLVSQTAARHGLVRIAVDAETGRTLIHSADAHLIETLSVDQALRPLGLTPDHGSLATRVSADTTYWALIDAHYPATLVGADGTPLPVHRTVLDDPEPAPSPSYTSLLEKLRTREGPDADAAWLDRELEAAVRTRGIVVVDVGMPDGSTRELTLEATGLGGGRLRGRDRAAGVERTLPVSSIRSARIVDQAAP